MNRVIGSKSSYGRFELGDGSPEAYYIHLKADRILSDEEREVKRKSCCCGFLEGLGRLVAFIFVLDGGVAGSSRAGRRSMWCCGIMVISEDI